MLLLCSDLALRNQMNGVKPYSVAQWSQLAERLVHHQLTPGALFHVSSEEIRIKLRLTANEVERIEKLMSRAGQLAVELSGWNANGIFTLTRNDPNYPTALKNKLKKNAPPLLYYSGDLALLRKKGVAVVGSRDVDEAGIKFTERLSGRCAGDGLNVISGGARGVDAIAEQVANRSGGSTVVVVAEPLERKIRNKETREAIMNHQSLILSSVRPDMTFQSYTAMERNKYIYALSDYAVVVSSDYNKGGTWAGATDNLKRGWVSMFVRREAGIPDGNVNLLQQANVYPITTEDLDHEHTAMLDWFKAQTECSIERVEPQQLSLFDEN